MASMVEIHELAHAATTSLLADSDVQALMMSGFQSVPLPTPPLSPQHLDTGPAPTLAGYTIDSAAQGSLEDQDASALLDQMLKCEGFTDTDSFLPGPDGIAFGTTPESDSLLLSAAHGMELLIQDCMWNSHAYEPRSIIGNVNVNGGGVYTPAPSPPPPIAEQPKEREEQPESEESSDSGNSNEVNEEVDDVQAECISPCDIFPTYTLVADKEGSRVVVKPCSTNTSTSVQSEEPRHHQAMSESDEEIDVVTVTERPTRMTTRKRQFSVSAPCSRQNSPAPPSPKKRKYTVKRLQRINSNCSSVGGDGTESDDEQRRASHNILERKRRNDLKFSFQILREQVPELEENQRAPKVTILRKAAEYIRRIQVEGNAMEQELERERKRENRLRQRLAFLKAMPVLC